MAIGLTTARMTEKPPEPRRLCALPSASAGLSTELAGAANAGTNPSVGGPMSAGCAPPLDMPTTPPATAVRLCSRRCGDDSVRNAEAPPQRGDCGDGPWVAAASKGAQTALLLLLLLITAGASSASPDEAGKQPVQLASVAEAEGLGQRDPLDRRCEWGDRRGVRSNGMRSAGLLAGAHASSAEAACRLWIRSASSPSCMSAGCEGEGRLMVVGQGRG